MLLAEALGVGVRVAVVLTRLGSCAPQGWSCRQADWQVESPLQFLTHWSLAVVQMKYGMVWVYSEELGDWPLLQTQEKSRVDWTNR